MTIDDVVLAAQARDGDSPAFVELVGRHQDRVFRFVLRMTGSRDDAMDLTQETFMKAWQAMPRWRPEAKFGTWLLQIARNGALDLLRRQGVVGFEPLEADAPFEDRSPGPEQQLRTRQRYELLETALRAIALEHREVLLLREVEDFSYAEIAATLGIAEGTVKSRIARARAALLEQHRRIGGENG
ncbi:MAG TPA: sigma-70 family RNA polymerase sigma factor [Burkholderiaceae bacterium]|nr:sigma-70 family RNA polymerase sigma factor [Burkholderiaceae bacterium]